MIKFSKCKPHEGYHIIRDGESWEYERHPTETEQAIIANHLRLAGWDYATGYSGGVWTITAMKGSDRKFSLAIVQDGEKWLRRVHGGWAGRFDLNKIISAIVDDLITSPKMELI